MGSRRSSISSMISVRARARGSRSRPRAARRAPPAAACRAQRVALGHDALVAPARARSRERRARARSSRAARAQRGAERQGVVERFIDRPNILELEALRGDPAGISSTSRRLRSGSTTRWMPGALRGEHLLLDAADRQHLAAQRDLAGHRDVGRGAAPGEQRGERGHHRDARRGPVLRHRAGGHVQVQVGLREELRVEAELAGVRAQPGARRLGRLAHHVAERAGELELALARACASTR